jgi:hypothetical protein
LFAFALIAVVALIALAWWWRHEGTRQGSSAARVRALTRPSGNYHCVELRFSPDACDAVKRIGTKRFLPDEAPGIPVPGCDAAKCSCRYVHHDDRRHRDRRSEFAQQASQTRTSTGEDRRTMGDRRNPPKTPFRPRMAR